MFVAVRRHEKRVLTRLIPKPVVQVSSEYSERNSSFRITSYNVCYTKLLRLSADAVIIDMDCYDKKDVLKYISQYSDVNIFVVNADEELKS